VIRKREPPRSSPRRELAGQQINANMAAKPLNLSFWWGISPPWAAKAFPSWPESWRKRTSLHRKPPNNLSVWVGKYNMQSEKGYRPRKTDPQRLRTEFADHRLRVATYGCAMIPERPGYGA
jgi:hypothetical protein